MFRQYAYFLPHRPPVARLAGLLVVLVAGSLVSGPLAAAERPTAPRLLPKTTLAYARIASTPEMREAMDGSGLGRMMQDEQLRPLVGDLYLAASELFSEVSDRVGVSLDELLSIPQGEVAIAVVPMQYDDEKEETGAKDESEEAIRRRIDARRNRTPLGVIGLIDTGEKAHLMRRVIERVEDMLVGDGFTRSERSVEGTEVVRLTQPEDATPFCWAEREGTFVFGIGEGMVEGVLKRWDGGGSKDTLAQNTDFGNVMSHCVGAEATRPQMTFYADPYHLVELAVKQNGGAAGFVWPILEQLQFDKIRGIGGSSFSGGEDEFESIIHVHLLLETPRDGILSVVRPGAGEVQPESWVPADVISYTTLHWDISRTYEGVDRIVSRFQDDEAMQRMVEKPLKDRTEIDLRTEILDQLTGRLGMVRWHELPMRLNSATQSWALETKDIEAARKTLDKLFKSFNENWEQGQYAGKTIYTMQQNEEDVFPRSFRRPQPTVAIIGNYIIASDSRKAIEHLIDTEAGTVPRLQAAPSYALIAAEVDGKLDAEEPFLFSYMRTEEIFRQIYEMAKNPDNLQTLRKAAEDNRVAKMLYESLQKNQLPAFSAFSKYFAPSGAFAYDSPTGLHYATFTLRPIE